MHQRGDTLDEELDPLDGRHIAWRFVGGDKEDRKQGKSIITIDKSNDG